jgi:hypothetical protein
MRRARFEAVVIEGHKGVRAVMVPFDPEDIWQVKPHRLAGRRHGWLVKGKLGGKKLEGYIGERWGNFFITVTDREPGETVRVELEPTTSAAILTRAIEQSKATTQPGKARPDAIEA